MKSIDLLGLLGKFKPLDDVETDHAFFKTKVPWVGSEAYLNILFKWATPIVVSEVAKALRFPTSLIEFYRRWNGAHLFVNTLSIYGCLPVRYELDRTNRFKLPPFNIMEVNRELFEPMKKRNLICWGSYGYDGSLVCVDRTSEEVVCFLGRDFGRKRQVWRDIEVWLTDEVSRLSLMFDANGKRLVAEENLLPGVAGARAH